MNRISSDHAKPKPSSDSVLRPVALYLCVSDRRRAEFFYKGLFAEASVMTTGQFTFFDLDGFVFGLFQLAAGSGRLLCPPDAAPQLHVRVADVRSEFEKIRAMTVKLVKPLQDSPRGKFFWFLDTEGNTVEFYESPSPQPLPPAP